MKIFKKKDFDLFNDSLKPLIDIAVKEQKIMKDEIKEILELFGSTDENIMFGDIVELNSKQSHLLLDYITNLQEKNEKLSNIINEFEIWLSNEIKFQKIIDRDYELIKTWVNLQEIKEKILNGGDE